MKCKKCNITTNKEQFCDSCRDELIKFYQLNEKTATEIEKEYGLIDGTVEFWCLYCQTKPSTNPISTQKPKSTINTKLHSTDEDNKQVSFDCQNLKDNQMSERKSKFKSFFLVSTLGVAFWIMGLDMKYIGTSYLPLGVFPMTIFAFIQASLSFGALICYPVVYFTIKSHTDVILKSIVFLFNLIACFIIFFYNLNPQEAPLLIKLIVLFASTTALPFMYSISKSETQDILKLFSYVVIFMMYVPFSTIITGITSHQIILMFAVFFIIGDILERKKNFVDMNGNNLSNIEIIERNIAKFMCLSCIIIPAFYESSNHNEILWDKITDTHYVLPLDE